MNKENLYQIGKRIGLEENDIYDIVNTTMENSNKFNNDIYKAGTRYGTISILEF